MKIDLAVTSSFFNHRASDSHRNVGFNKRFQIKITRKLLTILCFIWFFSVNFVFLAKKSRLFSQCTFFLECPINSLQLLLGRHCYTISGFRVTTIWKRQFQWNSRIHPPVLKVSRESDWSLHPSKINSLPYWRRVQSFIQIGVCEFWWLVINSLNCSVSSQTQLLIRWSIPFETASAPLNSSYSPGVILSSPVCTRRYHPAESW